MDDDNNNNKTTPSVVRNEFVTEQVGETLFEGMSVGKYQINSHILLLMKVNAAHIFHCDIL
jgi:hypothetical protein